MSDPAAGAERWRRVQEIFHAAADLPPREQQAWLDDACEGDGDLRAEVEAMLRADAAAGSLTAGVRQAAAQVADDMPPTLAGEVRAAAVVDADSAWIGRRVGAWRITGVLGRGGMGAVYEVQRDDGAFTQRAALKLIRADVDDEGRRRRFVEERQILARLAHPNIARLLDGGETPEGAPFLVMEAVDGKPITEACDAAAMPVAARLRLFVDVCRAVHFAHTQLIVHRDLKPSNVMVTADGIPKLLDFGIAKLIDPEAAAGLTLLGDVALTPHYASPEQVRAEPVSTATDVYSLGAILFELLTGRRAHHFDSYTLPEMVRVICDEEPVAPSAAVTAAKARRLRGDLDNIVLMALRKDPARRYASVQQLAEDLERHLDGRPVAARADSWGYRTAKFVRRNRLAVAAGTLVAASLVAGIVGTLWQARRAERRFQEVRKLANTFLFDFHDEIRDLPGSTAAREMVVSTALEYLDNLAADARDDQALQLELGAAYEKVGDVLGNPMGPNLGRTDDALAAYTRSLELRTAASGRAVDSAAEGRAVLQSHLKMADALLGGGKTAEARAHVDQGWALMERWGTPRDRIDALMRRGEVASRDGDLAAAEAVYREAVALAQAEAKARPGTATSTLLTWCAGRLGFVYKHQNRQEETLSTLALALAAVRQLRDAEPTRTAHARQVASLHNDRGDTLRSPFARAGMHPQQSLVEYEASLAEAEWIAGLDSRDFAARLGVLRARAQIADTWREIDPARSLPMFAALIPDVERAVADDPASFPAAWLHALLWNAYADAAARAGDLRLASRLYDTAVERITAMAQTDRGRKISARDLTKVHTERGQVRLGLGDVDGAKADAAACLVPAATLVLADARPLDLRDTALCHELAAAVASAQGSPGAAVQELDQALLRWREFGKRGLDSPFLRERIATAQRLRDEAARLASTL
jgi:tRNA A-37 threonylcarbamoyl transferase component Bud32/tetratricopeptide (TPR) repeat protein